VRLRLEVRPFVFVGNGADDVSPSRVSIVAVRHNNCTVSTVVGDEIALVSRVPTAMVEVPPFQEHWRRSRALETRTRPGSTAFGGPTLLPLVRLHAAVVGVVDGVLLIVQPR
jgi:hypothetical protein